MKSNAITSAFSVMTIVSVVTILQKYFKAVSIIAMILSLCMNEGFSQSLPTYISQSLTEEGNNSASSITIDVPSSGQEGDLLLVSIGIDDDDSLLDAGSLSPGWNILYNGNNNNDIGLVVLWKFDDGNEPMSYTFAMNETDQMIGSMVRYRGVDVDGPFIEVNIGSSSSSPTTPQIMTGVDSSIVLSILSLDQDDIISVPSNTIERLIAESSTSSINAVSLGIAEDSLHMAGAAGEYTWSSESDRYIGISLVLNPLVCEFRDLLVTRTECEGGQYDETFTFSFNGEPEGNIIYQRNGGSLETLVSPTSPTSVMFTGLTPAPGMMDTLIVYFEEEPTCRDTLISEKPSTCDDLVLTCNCVDYIYVNDLNVGGDPEDLVHKFAVDASSGALTEVGMPWYDDNTDWQPHGIAGDINGNLYIGVGTTEEIRKLTCDGEVLDFNFIDNDDLFNSNYGSKDGVLYFMNNGSDRIEAYSTCDGSLIGYMNMVGVGNVSAWGFYMDDENWYVADRSSASTGDRIISGSLDISMYTIPATVTGTELFDDVDEPMGITRDEVGNYYIVTSQDFDGGNNPAVITKYDSNGVELGSVNWTTTGANSSDGEAGFFGARGIVYSKMSGYIYVGNFNNCITVFDTSLVQQVTLNVGNPTGGQPKGVGIVTECCPSQSLNQDISLCSPGEGEKVFLQDILNCGEGALCGGDWSELSNSSGGNLTYDECDNSITVTGTGGCAVYNIMNDNLSSQCGEFSISVNVCISEVEANVSAQAGTCTIDVANNDAIIQITNVINGDEANYSIGATYSGPAYGDVSGVDVSSGSGSVTGLMHNTQYTVRVYSGGDECFTDIAIMTPEVVCDLSECNCSEYIYLNEPTTGHIHKFEINGSDGSLTEVLQTNGDKWYNGNELTNPHGLAIDLNGFIYVGEDWRSGGIRKLFCDGTIVPETGQGGFEYASEGQYNIGSIDNTLYFNNTNEAFAFGGSGQEPDIRALDICTQTITGSVDFCETDIDYDWGYFIDPNTEIMYATHGVTGSSNYLWIFEASDFDNDPNTCISHVDLDDPLPAGVIRGVTTDGDGNIYIVKDGGGTGQNFLVKYDSNLNYLGMSAIDSAEDGTGYAKAIGIVYSEFADRLYVSTQSAIDDCVSMFDTDLNYLATAVPSPGTGDNGKGIGIKKECCPTADSLTYNEIICSGGNGEVVFLQDVFNCGDGVVCEGMWSVRTPNSNQVFNDCNLSIEVNGSGCGTYVLEKTTPASGTSKCDPFKIVVNICTEVPELDLSTSVGTCDGTTPNDDATISLFNIINVDEANYSAGASYVGPGYGDATGIDVSGGSGSITGLIHNTQYTVRVFNGASDCFIDLTTTTANVVCGGFDLALTKVISGSTPGPYELGGAVSYDVTVVNQGSVVAYDIAVADYYQIDELNYVDLAAPSMTAQGNAVSILGVGPGYEIEELSTGDSVIVTLNFTIDVGFMGTSIINNAEIVDASDTDGGTTALDEDSPLTDTNDGTTNELATDNDIDDNSIGGSDNASDEDDYDPALIVIGNYSLGNQVWNDENNNGTIDGDEMGIEGVEVLLHYYNPITMMCEIVDTLTTDGDGLYLFDSLSVGDYIVEITATNFEAGGVLENFASSTGNGPSDLVMGTYEDNLSAIDPDSDLDGDDSGVFNGNAMFTGAVASDTITLGGLIDEPTGEDPDNDPLTVDEDENLTVDFGFVELYSLGNQVWSDSNNNGTIDGGEMGIEGVQVVLHYYDPASMTCIPVDTLLTDMNGLYLFDSLGAGDYIVELTAANFEVGGSFENFVSSTGSGLTDIENGPNEDAGNQIDPDGDVDGDDNGVLDGNAMLPGSIVSDTLTLGGMVDEPTGEDPDNDLTTADENENLTVDFGLVPLHSIGNQVWTDANNNGMIDAGEDPIEGVEVVLHYVDPVTGLCVALDTAYTDAMGLYFFDSLIVGDYLLEITPENFEEGEPLAGSISSTGSGAGNTAIGPNEDGMNPIDPDTNTDGDDNGIFEGNAMFPGSVVSDTLSLGGMEDEPTGENPDNDDSSATDEDSNLTVDFGFVPMYSLGNQVWYDENYNGLVDGMEMGIEGVTVELHWYNPMTMLCEVIETVMTDADGLYLFDSLVAGQYIVMIPDTDLGAGGVLQDFQSTSGTFNMGGPYEDATNPIDADGDVDSDDNGVLGLNPNFPTYVASDTLTLGGDPEPTGEDPDNDDYTNDENENLSLDFGFVDKVYDVALTKTTMMMTGNSFGDTINFMIKVVNQGNTPLTNIDVTDYIATGFAPIMGLNTAVTDAGGTGWIDNMDMTATYTIGDTLAPNEEVYVNFFVEIMMSEFSNAFVNRAEVSMFQDTLGNSTDGTGPYAGGIEDEDSTPDSTLGNDAGGEPGSEADNYVDGDGTGGDGDGVAATDEDDEDPALVQVIDIALTKVVAPGQAPYAYGTPVDFTIEVENQGNEPLYDIEVTDYIPAGYEYVESAGWTFDVATSTATTVIDGPMEMWDIETLTITLTPIQQVPSTDPTAWTNVAEVSQIFALDPLGVLMDVSDQDIDSQSDNNPTNDPGGAPGTDSDNSSNGDGNTGGGAPGDTDAMVDEDDSDPALLPIMDLALTKQYVDTTTIPMFGDELEFFISIHNQGNVPATNIEISEYVPGSLTEVGATNDPLWDFSTTPATYVYADTLAAGESDTIYLNMVFQPASTYEDFINYAEISEIADTMGNNTTDNADIIADADSTPDNINGNDDGGEPDLPGAPSGSDNTIDNEAVDGVADEDDHDPLLLGFVDVALVKTLTTTGPVQVGQDVTFEIELINQGTFDIKNFIVSDYIPAGFELSINDMNGWAVDMMTGIASATVTDTVGFAESTTIDIILTVLPDAQANNMVNEAEITSFDFGFGGDATMFDIDSDADAVQGDDAGGAIYTDSDDVEDGDGTGTPYDDVPETDEDDHDPAVPNVLDLALTKMIDPMTPAVRPGDVVTFTIEVCNQGNLPVSSVIVEDRIPEGLILSPTDANGWTVVDATTVSNTVGMLERDGCATLEIDMEVLPESTADQMINVAEITEVYDTSAVPVEIGAFDIDSTPNDDNGEAARTLGGSDDNSTGGQVPAGEDSDDADPAAPPMMDLAIQKINPVVGPSTRGDIVPFEITVYNQGNMVAEAVEVTDYIPAGLMATASNPGWTLAGATATHTVAELQPGADTTIVINLEILQSATPMNVVNMSEISSATDTLGIVYSGEGNDYDSDYDADNTNDVGNEIYDFENNDELNDYGIGHGADGIDDEDDHDQAWALLCDGMACNGDINLSIDESCTAVVTPDMLMTGDLFPNHVYEITIRDEDGNIVPNDFGLGTVGMSYEVSISNPLCSDNNCWMNMDVEYKFKPTINCPDTLRVSCAMAGMIDSIGLPTVDGNCTEVKVLKLDEYPIFIECDPLYTGGLIREFRAEDEFGNLSDSICSQVVLFERTNLSTIVPPSNRWIVDGNELSCDNNLELTSEGYPTPGSINSVPRLELDGGSLLDLYPFVNGSICNGYVTFTDKELGGSTECVTKIKRTWVVGEWHCSNPEPRTFVQILEIVDFTGPEFDPVADITVSTGSFDCEAAISMPLPTITDACNGENIRLDLGSPVGSYANYGGESIMLPSGIHEIIYNAYDDCGNITIDTVLVTVVDQAQPIAVCDLHTVVSIGLDGLTYVTAESIDDGSFDECGEVTLSIARMDDPGFADLTGFADKAPINCSDIGTEVMVGLLVTDKGGNTNMCMVSVEVQDKVEAQMIVPGPVTVDCNYGYDENNLSAFFGSVEIFDNCDTINTRTEEVMLGELNDCGAGELVREIRLIENGVEVGYGTQVITFEPGTTLQGSDILWPVASLDLEGCPDDMSNMAMTGEPTVTERDCQRIGMRHEDETFPFNTNGTCRKLIRTWYVIDWCIDHDEIGGALQPYTFTQTIKLNNTVAPTFVEVPVDTMYCSYAVDCGPIAVGGLTATAEDDCTETSDLYTTYEVKDEGGSIVEYGLGLDANGVYDIGIYTVKYTIEDKCGNVNSRSTIFEVRNCKQPTPYCLDGLSTALVPMDLDEDGTPEIELVMLTPGFFDGGSFHPCGYEVTLSFSSDVNDTLAVYGCNDLGDNTVELWVTDVNGNQAYCEASLLIEDNNGVEIECIPDGNRAIVQGRIYTDEDQEIGTVQVDLEGSDLPWYVTTETGEYVFDDMPMGGTYTVKPEKNDDVKNGVNTLDLVFIQRHLLDLQPITNTYKLIAADINNDGSIKPSDLLDLRKVILGVNETFSNNTSWRFVDEGYVFEDPQHPLDEDFDETYNIASLSEDMWIDFIGLKVGDINGDATPTLKGGEEVFTRSGGLFELEIEDRNLVQGDQIVDVYSSTVGEVNGLQYALALIDAEVIDIHPGALDLTLASGATVGDEYRVSHASEERVEIERGDKLFSIVLRIGEAGRVSEKLSITNSYMNSEVYVGEELAVKDMAINFIGESEEEGLVFAVKQNSPNPWTTNTNIEMLLPRSGMVDLTVTDGQGKLVYEVSEYLESGIQSIGLTSEEITTSGMYIYKVEYETEVITGKMIRIE